MPRYSSRLSLLLFVICGLLGIAALALTVGDAHPAAWSVYADFVAMAALTFGVFALYDWFVPHDTWAAVFREKNTAAALFMGLVYLGLCILATAT